MNVKFFATYRMIVGQGCINLPAPRDVLELLEILDVRLLDHFIVAGTETVSMAERGLV